MDVYNKPFGQFMKMMSPGKEKIMLENIVSTLDKINLYQTKQTQLQYLLYSTSQTAMETTIKSNFNKVKDNASEINNFNNFFTEWINTNELAFTNLFATDEFSELKAEVTSLSMGIKKDFDNQLISTLENTPFAFKTDMDEVYKSLYDLKKMVKQMQQMLEINVDDAITNQKTSSTSKTKKK
jgi:hypothetical protein